MRFWLLVSLVLASSSVVAAPKPAVVLSGPPALTKLVGKELSKKYTPRPGSLSGMPTAKEVRDATAPYGAIAVVMCQSAGAFVTLQVLNGADGTPLDTVTFKGTLKKLPKTLPRPQLAALFFAVGSGKAPGKEAAPVAEAPPAKEEPKVAPKKEEPKKEEVAKADEPPKKSARVEKEKEAPPAVVETPATPATPSSQPAIRASVGFGGFNRSFGWSGNPSPSLATANQPFSGNISVEGSWFPGAHFTSSFAANFGVFMSGDFGVGMVSRVDESRFAHSASRLRFGGLVRLPLGSSFTLHAHLGYARQEFTTSTNAVNDGSARPNIPDLLFNGFRGGLGLRLRIVGTVELDAQGGFMTVANKGELASSRYFPGATAFAVDAGGGLSVEVAPSLRLRAGAEWNRYFITLNPAEDSTFFARTAADQYITATASLQWVM